MEVEMRTTRRRMVEFETEESRRAANRSRLQIGTGYALAAKYEGLGVCTLVGRDRDERKLNSLHLAHRDVKPELSSLTN